MFLFLLKLIPSNADKDLVQTIPHKRHFATLVARAKQRSAKGMKYPPSHCSVVFQNSRTAKIGRWKASFEVLLIPLSLAQAKQAPRLGAQYPRRHPGGDTTSTAKWTVAQ